MKWKPRASRRQSGFTIVEVMVVIVIMGIITTVVASMFAQGSSALQHGEAHNALQRAYRLISARVTPYISSAFDTNGVMGGATILDPNQTADAPPYTQAPRDPSGVNPILNALNEPSSTLRFLTTEDFLAPAYPTGLNTSAAAATSLGTIGTFVYQIDLDVENGLVLQKLDPTDGFNVVNNGGLVQKPLFFSRENASIVPPVRYYHPAPDVLIMEVKLTGDDDLNDKTRQVKPTQTFRTTFNLPAKIDT